MSTIVLSSSVLAWPTDTCCWQSLKSDWCLSDIDATMDNSLDVPLFSPSSLAVIQKSQNNKIHLNLDGAHACLLFAEEFVSVFGEKFLIVAEVYICGSLLEAM